MMFLGQSFKGFVVTCLMLDTLATPLCTTPDCANYPRDPLTFEQLRRAVIGEQNVSKVYYEVFSMDPAELKRFGLPVLRKTSIRWIMEEAVPFPGRFINDYAGWIPYNPLYPDNTGKCEFGRITFETIVRRGMRMSFKFDSVYPTVEVHVGTSYSSFPEEYLINWYCPETELVKGGKFGIKWCKSGARMSIYSPHAFTQLPFDKILDDMCRNQSPSLSDPRWTMTYDAPQMCDVTSNSGRKKRSTDIRHYL